MNRINELLEHGSLFSLLKISPNLHIVFNDSRI